MDSTIGHGRDVFSLNECHHSFAARLALKPIANESFTFGDFSFLNDLKWLASCGA